MPTRYRDREKFTNTEETSEHLREARGVKKIEHYNTAEFRELTENDFSEIKEVPHTWTTGDRFYKLSYKYYGVTTYWWIIARYNNCPTEAHVKLGQQIFIPVPLNKMLGFYGA